MNKRVDLHVVQGTCMHLNLSWAVDYDPLPVEKEKQACRSKGISTFYMLLSRSTSRSTPTFFTSHRLIMSINVIKRLCRKLLYMCNNMYVHV